MIGRLSDMSPGLLAMYGLLAWTLLGALTAPVIGRVIHGAGQRERGA